MTTETAAAANTNAAPAVTKRVTPETLPELVKDLREADSLARAHVAGMADGGTCNFDSPVLAIDKKDAKWAAAAIKCAGGDSFEWKMWRRFAGLVLSFGRPGQGDRNTRYATHFEATLKARGWPTTMYYQMD